MAVSKKGSRKIVINDMEFRWKATGNDGWITVVIWPVDRDTIKITGQFGYHDEHINVLDERGAYVKTKGQIIITNRVIRQVIEHVGIENILNLKGQLSLGNLEDIYDINNALRVSMEERGRTL